MFLSLLVLGVLAFSAFFLVGTMASLKWLNRSDIVDPKPVKLGQLAIQEKVKNEVFRYVLIFGTGGDCSL